MNERLGDARRKQQTSQRIRDVRLAGHDRDEQQSAEGDRLEFPGLKSFAGTVPVRTSPERMASMSTSRNRVQAMKPSKASREVGMGGSLRAEGLPRA